MYSSTRLLLGVVFCMICGFNSFRPLLPRIIDGRLNRINRNTRMAAFGSGKFVPHSSTFFFNGNSGQVNEKFRLDALKLNTTAVCDLLIEKPKNKLKALLSSLPAAAKKAAEKLKRPSRSQSSVVVNGTSSPFAIALCVGGDGTVNWIMDETSALARNASTSSSSPSSPSSQDIRFALIPSGTGNDLYRHMMQLMAQHQSPAELKILREKIDLLSRCGNDGSAQEALSLFSNNKTVCIPFDRWSLTIEPLEDTLEVKVYRKLLKQFGPERAEQLYSQWFWDTMPQGTKYHGPPRLEPVVKTFNNYFGMGVDAAVTNQFKEWRSVWPRWWFQTNLYASRFFYGLAWVWLSLFDLFPRPLTSDRPPAGGGEGDVTVYAPHHSSNSSRRRRGRRNNPNGEELDLFSQSYTPSVVNNSSTSNVLVRLVRGVWNGFRNALKMPSRREYAGLVVANIGSFAGGGRLWPSGTSREGGELAESRSDDGKLELTGLTNWAHLCLVTFRLDNAYPLSQEGGLTLVNRRRELPMQVDGEPWIQHYPCKISIKHLNSVKLLLPRLPSTNSQ